MNQENPNTPKQQEPPVPPQDAVQQPTDQQTATAQVSPEYGQQPQPQPYQPQQPQQPQQPYQQPQQPYTQQQPQQQYQQYQQQPQQPQPQQPQPMYVPAPITQMTGGMKFAWLVVGALVGIAGPIIAWLTMFDKHPDIKREAIKFSIIGLVVGYVIGFIVGMIIGFGSLATIGSLGTSYYW